MKRNALKMALITLSAILLMTGCRTVPVSLGASSRETIKTDPGTTSSGAEYADYVLTLGYLIMTVDWANAEQISPADYAIWYTDYLREQGADICIFDDGDGSYRFPEKELEDTLAMYFEVSSEHLHLDQHIYNSDAGVYLIPTSLPAFEKEFEMTGAEVEGENLTLYFNVKQNEETIPKKLTARLYDDRLIYLSLITE